MSTFAVIGMIFVEGTLEGAGEDFYKYNIDVISIVTVKTLYGLTRVCFNDLIMTYVRF